MVAAENRIAVGADERLAPPRITETRPSPPSDTPATRTSMKALISHGTLRFWWTLTRA